MGGGYHLVDRTILKWKSKVQYKKGTPYISLIKHLSCQHSLAKGNEIICKLISEEGKLSVKISLE